MAGHMDRIDAPLTGLVLREQVKPVLLTKEE
jgi:hypothetical protein